MTFENLAIREEMNIKIIRKSVLVTVVAVGLVAGGFWIGRLAAGPLSGRHHFSAERIFNRIADRLALSDSQKNEIKQILKSHRSEILSQTQALIDARKALRQAVSADTVDANLIREKANALGKVEGDAAVLRAQIRSEIWPVLSDEQKAKVDTFHQRWEQDMHKLVSSIQNFLSSK